MTEINGESRGQISCTYYFNGHFYIGKDDGALIQMNMNGEVICRIETKDGVIGTIFCIGNKLVTCGQDNTLIWDITYPLKKFMIGWISYSYSASFGDMIASSNKEGPILMGPVGPLCNIHRNTITFGSLISCFCMNGPVIFAGFENGEFLKVDYLTGKLVYIYKANHGDITLNNNGVKLVTKPGNVKSICTWRDSIIVTSSSDYSRPMAMVIRWKLMSTDLYEPDLFLKITSGAIKIIDDQLFEIGMFLINCWSWDRKFLRAFIHSSRARYNPTDTLFVNGCIYIINNDMEIWKRIGIFIEVCV